MWPRIVICGVFALLAFACLACAGARSWAQGRCDQISAEGDNGSLLRLSFNDRVGQVSIVDPNSGKGTLIPTPRLALLALAREIAGAPSRLPSIQVMDTEQTLVAMPITIKEGVGGVVMVKVTRVSRNMGSTYPVLSLYAKRGDETWDNEVRFSHHRLDRLVNQVARLLTN